jgi:hypothetical protein
MNQATPEFRRGGRGYAGMAPHPEPGRWAAFGCSAQTGRPYWIVRRDNEAWSGGWQGLTGPKGQLRRFGSEAAAQKVADAANKA